MYSFQTPLWCADFFTLLHSTCPKRCCGHDKSSQYRGIVLIAQNQKKSFPFWFWVLFYVVFCILKHLELLLNYCRLSLQLINRKDNRLCFELVRQWYKKKNNLLYNWSHWRPVGCLVSSLTRSSD